MNQASLSTALLVRGEEGLDDLGTAFPGVRTWIEARS